MRKFYFLLSLSFSTLFLHAQNNALSFDGVNDYVSLGSSAALKPTAALTVEFWAKSPNWNVASEQEMISCFEGGGYGLYLSGGNLWFQVWPSGASAYRGVSYPVSNLANNTWYHFAGTFDGRYIKLYVNGALVGNDDLLSTKTVAYAYPSNSFLIGADAGTASLPAGMYFNGQIDEVRFWNVQRTAAEIKGGMYATITSGTGLVAYYGANEGSGTTLNNSTATTGINGTLVNGTAWTSSPVQYSSNALNFDGVDDQVVVPAKSMLDLTTGTVECWIKPGSMNYNGTIVANRGTGGTRFSFHINTVANTIGLWNNTFYTTVSYTFTTGQWYHVAFVCNGTNTSIYINGAYVGQTGAFSSLTGQPLSIGIAKNSGGDGEPFLGEIDEVRIWNTQRTQTEIQTYKDHSLTGSEAGLVALYTFNQGSAAGNNANLTTLTDLTANNNHGTLSGFLLSGASSNFTSHGMVILPVQLTTFAAVRNRNDVALQWQTSLEQNTKSFVVERSVDGVHYTAIGSVAATGLTGKAENYSYSDVNPQAGISYYRLKMIDRDGAFSYSPIRTVRASNSRTFTCTADASGNVLLTLEQGTNEPFAISDLSGRVVAQGKLVQGQARIASLPAGIYVATASSANENLQVKFMVRK